MLEAGPLEVDHPVGHGEHQRSEVEDGASLGADTMLVAPSHVGAGARTGAGAIVTANSSVAPGDTWIGVPARPLRAKQSAPDRDAGKKEPSA